MSDFITDAIRTEAPADNIMYSRVTLVAMLKEVVRAGNVLDDMKKATFYRKPSALEAVAKYTEECPPVALSVSAGWPNPRVLHAVLGCVTEAAEMAEALIKQLETGEFDETNMLEESGDLLWYLAVMFDEFGTDFDTEQNRVIAKLKQRFPEKFTDEAANNRDLAAERKVLEGE